MNVRRVATKCLIESILKKLMMMSRSLEGCVPFGNLVNRRTGNQSDYSFQYPEARGQKRGGDCNQKTTTNKQVKGGRDFISVVHGHMG